MVTNRNGGVNHNLNRPEIMRDVQVLELIRQNPSPGKIAERYYRSRTEGGWETNGAILSFRYLTYEVKRGDTFEDIDRAFEAKLEARLKTELETV